MASNLALDAWKGAKDFASDEALSDAAFISRQDYEEKGVGFLAEHQCSNKFCVTPETVNESDF